MTRIAPLTLSILLLVGAVAVVPLLGLAQSTAQPDQSNRSAAPGERIAGVVGVQGATFGGEVDRRAFAHRLANATTNESKAAVLAAQYDTVRERQAALADRRAELTEAHRNGTLSDGAFKARMARLHAQSRTVQALANRTAAESAGLPAEALQAKGVNATAIRTLQADAANLTGPETAAVARRIAGPEAGGRPVGDTVPAVAENRSQRGADRAVTANGGHRGPGDDSTTPAEAGGQGDGGEQADAATATDAGNATDGERPDAPETESDAGRSSGDEAGGSEAGEAGGSEDSDAGDRNQRSLALLVDRSA